MIYQLSVSVRVCLYQVNLVRNLAATYYCGCMPIHTVNIEDAKDHFFDLIATTAEGGEVIIVDKGKALARLIPATDAAAYQAHPPTAAEVSTDDDPLAWEADGWENVG